MKKLTSWNRFQKSVANRLIDRFIKSSETERAEKKDDRDEMNFDWMFHTSVALVKIL